MAASVMPSNISLIVKRLQDAYPQLQFEIADEAYYSSTRRTVFYKPLDTDTAVGILLHEVGHALLGHCDFKDDITLVRYESDAWHHAGTTLAPALSLTIDDELIQDHLETYREWLHTRSLCPRCNQTGLQIGTKLYSCINCDSRWKVNEARTCRLKRQLAK